MTTTKTTLEYRTNNAYDTILVVRDGIVQSTAMVTPKLLAEFRATEGNEAYWEGQTVLDSDEQEEWTQEARDADRDQYGELVATSTDGQLTIVNDELWASRLAFMLQTGE